MSLNTVAQCDARLLRMELEWKINQSGPFPDKIRNTIANIRAALVIREAEASQKIPTPTTTSTPTTTPTTTTPAHTKPAALLALTEDDLNTVEKIDTQLARMELHWARTRSGPFPERARIALAKLRASLEEVPTLTSAATPTTPSTTTTTTDSNTPASTETTTVAMAATAKPHETTRGDSEKNEGGGEMRRNESGEGNKETRTAEEKSAERRGNEIVETRGDKRSEGEQTARRASAKGGGNEGKSETASEGIEEGRSEVRGDAPPPTAQPAFEHDNGEGNTRAEPQQEHSGLENGEDGIFERLTLEFGENEVHEQGELEYERARGNAEVGNGLYETREGEDHGIRERDDDTTHPAPPTTASTPANPVPYERARIDWATDTNTSIGPVPNPSDFHPTKPRFPLASPEHAPRLFGNRIPPPQPIRTTPKRSVTWPRHNTTPRACSPAVDAPSTAPPQVPAERAPTAVVHAPRDLSGLRSSTPNPWRSLRRRYYSHDSHTPRRFTGRRQYPPKYPANTHIPATTISKPPALAPVRIFETVRHPLGIGPTKPIIRVPVSTTMDTPPHPAPLAEHTVVKSVPPLPQTRCECGRLIPGSEAQKLPIVAPHYALSTFMSDIFSSQFFFPTHFFSRFRFS